MVVLRKMGREKEMFLLSLPERERLCYARVYFCILALRSDSRAGHRGNIRLEAGLILKFLNRAQESTMPEWDRKRQRSFISGSAEGG